MLPSRHGPGRLGPEQARSRVIDDDTMRPDARRATARRSGHAPGAVRPPLTGLSAEAAPPDTVRSRAALPGHRRGHRRRQAARPHMAGGVRAGTAAGRATAGHGGHSGRRG